MPKVVDIKNYQRNQRYGSDEERINKLKAKGYPEDYNPFEGNVEKDEFAWVKKIMMQPIDPYYVGDNND